MLFYCLTFSNIFKLKVETEKVTQGFRLCLVAFLYFTMSRFFCVKNGKCKNEMKTKIAVATVNGRAYYKLVNELQRKQLPFFSIKPWDPIPLDVKVVLTTKEEQGQISHPKILSFKTESNPGSVIDEAVLIIQGKQNYQKIVVGVDPGKSCGIALLGDNKVIETLTTSSVESATNLIIDNLKRFQAETRMVCVGDGTPEYSKRLLLLLDIPLHLHIELISLLVNLN